MLKIGLFATLGMLLLAGTLFSGCSGKAAADGDVVRVNYTGTLDDGTQFDSSIGREPLEFTVGAGQMIAGFDRAVVGMKVGDKKTITIPAADAYGPHRDDLVRDVGRDELPPGMDVEIGDRLQGTSQDGNITIFTVTATSDTSVTLDANHELAGKDLTFEVEMVEIK